MRKLKDTSGRVDKPINCVAFFRWMAISSLAIANLAWYTTFSGVKQNDEIFKDVLAKIKERNGLVYENR